MDTEELALFKLWRAFRTHWLKIVFFVGIISAFSVFYFYQETGFVTLEATFSIDKLDQELPYQVAIGFSTLEEIANQSDFTTQTTKLLADQFPITNFEAFNSRPVSLFREGARKALTVRAHAESEQVGHEMLKLWLSEFRKQTNKRIANDLVPVVNAQRLQLQSKMLGQEAALATLQEKAAQFQVAQEDVRTSLEAVSLLGKVASHESSLAASRSQLSFVENLVNFLERYSPEQPNPVVENSLVSSFATSLININNSWRVTEARKVNVSKRNHINVALSGLLAFLAAFGLALLIEELKEQTAKNQSLAPKHPTDTSHAPLKLNRKV